MNKERRNEIKQVIREIEGLVASILDDERDSFYNIPDGLQNSENGMNSMDAQDNLESAIDSLEEAISYLDDII